MPLDSMYAGASGYGSNDVKQIHQRVQAMRLERSADDRNAQTVRMVRRNRMHELYPQHFSDDMPQAAVANTIDIAARDTAELIAPLPSLACASGNMMTAADVARAGKKNRIGSYYWEKSRLALINMNFADATLSYGKGAYIIEPDFAKQCPRIRWESSFGLYYFKDRFGELVWLAKITRVSCLSLCAKFPDLESRIRGSGRGGRREDNQQLELVTYLDRHRTLVYLPECGYLTLADAPNPISRVPAVVAERPDQEDYPQGQYDAAVYPMLAKAIMTMYQLNAADKAINAPIAMPDDVTEFGYGPDATMRSQNPSQIQRVRLDIPDDIFMVNRELDQAVKEGSRYPEARAGGVTGNIITGRGVEALAGTLVTQVSTMQAVIGQALEEATSKCFEMDAAVWPDVPKRIQGVISGKPFELNYIPSRDIGDSYSCKVTYGFASGQTPAQAIVALLQLRGDRLISRDTTMRQLPVDLDVEEEQRRVDVEGLNDAAMQGVSGLAQAFGPMVMQGQNPVPVLTSIAKVITMRERGTPIAEALLKAFTPPEKPPEQQSPPAGQQPGQPGPPGGQPELPPGIQPNGLTEGVPYGQQGAPPGGMPAVAGLLSRLRGNGDALMEASTSRKRAIGAG